MAEGLEKNSTPSDRPDVIQTETLPTAVNEATAIPKGTIDPVYEAKARVLNHAVCLPLTPSNAD
jgi:hypothetical protein